MRVSDAKALVIVSECGGESRRSSGSSRCRTPRPQRTRLHEAADAIGARSIHANVAKEEDVATNVFGAMLVARESARHFVTQNRGNIVNVASTAGLRGYAGGTIYSSSKFALHGLTECWRAELRKHDIRVMQINPSEVQTDFVNASGRPPRAFSERKLQSVDIANAIVSMLELDDRGFIPELSVWATNPD